MIKESTDIDNPLTLVERDTLGLRCKWGEAECQWNSKYAQIYLFNVQSVPNIFEHKLFELIIKIIAIFVIKSLVLLDIRLRIFHGSFISDAYDPTGPLKQEHAWRLISNVWTGKVHTIFETVSLGHAHKWEGGTLNHRLLRPL